MQDMGGVSVKRVETVADAMEMMRWLGERRPVLAFDTETCGLLWWREPVRLVQFGDALTGWAMDFQDWRGLAREVLTTYEGDVVGHNLKFDLHMLRTWGGMEIPARHWHDTMVASQILHPLDRHGLKPLATKHIHPKAAGGEAALQQKFSEHKWWWDTVPTNLPEYWIYGALDTVFTARLHEQFQNELAERQLMHLYELEMRCQAVVYAMERSGATIDVPYSQDTHDKLDDYGKRLSAWCKDNYNVAPSKDEQVRARLLADGVHLTHLTESGDAYSVDKDVLGNLTHPLAEPVLKFRTVTKFKQTFFRRFIELHEHSTLHADIKQMGAKTGRMSVSRPPLQQLPSRENPVLPNRLVRDSFIPSEGCSIVKADYSQIEMRLFAHFAREEAMISAIRNGVHLHVATAQAVYNTTTPSKAQISVAKGANFARVYGAGVPKFSLTARIPEEEGRAFMSAYDERFPGVNAFANLVIDTARARKRDEGMAYVRAPSGRIHAVYTEDDCYKLVNYLCQGTAADVFKQALVNLDAAGMTEMLRLPVHDEILLNVPDEHVEEVRHALPPLMNDTTNFLVPLTVEVDEPLKRWGDAYASVP